MFVLKSFIPLMLAVAAHAAPTLLQERSVTALFPATIASFKPFTYYTGVAYCQPADILAWNCKSCKLANPGFKPVASGGDGIITQFWYVGYDPTLTTIIVGHQGTDAEKIVPLLTDANINLVKPSSKLFPGVPSNVEVHQGFADSHARSAAGVLAGVKKAMSLYGATSVTTVGHSLGGALSLLEAIYLPLHLPAGTKFKTYTYGAPRAGNKAFASYVDSHASVTRITNKRDIVPIIPGRFFGYAQVSGETHIQEANGAWVACSGQDSTESGCTISDVPNLLVGDRDDHTGPYDGVLIDC